MKLISQAAIVIGSIAVVSCGNSRPTPSSIRDFPTSLDQLEDNVAQYQIGPEWGKKPITAEYLAAATPQLQKAAKATARVSLGFGGATAFVIGEKNGAVRLATNHHVIEDASSCRGARISFPLLNIKGLGCDKIIGTWTDLDLTVFTVSGLTDTQRQLLLGVASDFSYKAPLRKGQKLMTIGFGIAANAGQKNMMAELDSDCKVYSKDGDARFIADPDEINPGPYKTWAFAMGCDVSHGDSGSAMFDRETGAVVGLLFTGKIPKDAVARDRKWLDDQYASDGNGVWKELSFAVPAYKIDEIAGNALRQ